MVEGLWVLLMVEELMMHCVDPAWLVDAPEDNLEIVGEVLEEDCGVGCFDLVVDGGSLGFERGARLELHGYYLEIL